MEQYLHGEVSSLIHSLVHSFVHLMNMSDDNHDGDGQHLLSSSVVLETMLKALPIFFFPTESPQTPWVAHSGITPL